MADSKLFERFTFKEFSFLLIFLIASLFIIAISSVPTYAAPAEDTTIQHSGTSGTCTWELYTDGTMVIRSTNGDEGTLANPSSYSAVPWYAYRTSIISVEFHATVYAGTNVGYMFFNCSNLISIDLSGFDTSNATTMQT